MQRTQIAPGVFLNVLDAEKFNRCRIAIHLRYPARRQSATDAAVLALVLERGYAGCPDMTALSRKLAALYGADLGVDLAGAGGDRLLSADVCGIKQQFALAGERLADEYADIVFGTIFDPYLVDGVFDPEAVAIEKETLRRRLQAEFNDKRLYCVRQARRRFYGDSPAGIELNGYLDEVDAVTPQSVKAEYDRILASAAIDVMVQGADADRVADRLLQKLAGVRRAPAAVSPALAIPVQPVQHYTEAIPGVTQAKLCMLFTRGTTEALPSIHLLRVAMGLLGGSATSRLFRNVREKQSLCYYCACGYSQLTSALCIDSGIEPANAQRAQQAILKELRELAGGPITAQELREAKVSYLGALRSVGDSLSSIEAWAFREILRGTYKTPQQVAEAIERTGEAEIRAVLSLFTLSVSYLLEGRGNPDEV